VPQVGQTRCGSLGLWQRGQRLTGAFAALWLARRLSRRALDVLFFGTAMVAES
jgi:hypothetical protein